MKKIILFSFFSFVYINYISQITPCSELFFSEYIEGSSTNKAIEIYNPTSNTIDLSNYSLKKYNNGSTTATNIAISGSIVAGGVFVIVETGSSTDSILKTKADLLVSLGFNGDDAIALYDSNGNMIDLIGQIGFDPGTAWTTNNVSTANMTLIRKSSINAGNNNNIVFDPSLEWIAYPINDFSYLRNHNSVSCNTDSCTPKSLMLHDTICNIGDSIVFGNQVLTQAGIYIDSLLTVDSCDSIVTMNLHTMNCTTPCTPKSLMLHDTICNIGDSIVFGNQVLTQAGTYIDSLLTVYSCDSIVTMNLHTMNCNQIISCSELFFSEYIEGSSTNKAIEIYNPTSNTIDLSNYSLKKYNNGSTTATNIAISGSIVAGGVFVIVETGSSTDSILKTKADLLVTLGFNGDDAIALYDSNGNMIDLIGQIGFDPGTAWTTNNVSTANMTLIRKSSINAGNNNNIVFDPSLEWIAYPINDFSYLRNHNSVSCNTDSCTPKSLMLHDTICNIGDSIVFGNQVLTQAGIYIDSFLTVDSCDSIVTMNLHTMNCTTPCTPKSLMLHDTICNIGDSIVFGNQVLTQAGTYFDSLLTVDNCDSIVTMNLHTMNCTTPCTPKSLMLHDTICNTGDSIVFGNQVLTQAGTYVDSLYTIDSCDSIITMNLHTMNCNQIISCSELFFSEYIEGSSTNKAIEIYNPTSNTIDLSNYSLKKYNNGSTTATNIAISGSIVAGGVFVIVETGSSTDSILKTKADLLVSLGFNGDDAIALYDSNGNMIDLIGQIGFDPGTAWTTNNVSTANMTLIRKSSINAGNNNNIVFDPSLEWIAYPINDFSYLRNHNSVSCNTDSCTPKSLMLHDTICNIGDSIVFGNQVLTQAGTYIDSLLTVDSCDSIVTMNLHTMNCTTPCTPKSLMLHDTICNTGDSIVFGNQVLTQAGTYIDSLLTVDSCDSIITMNLHTISCICPPYYIYDTVYVCGSQDNMSYNLNGKIFYPNYINKIDTLISLAECDTFLKITFIINEPIDTILYINTCNQFTSEKGNTYFNSGIYYEYDTNIYNCINSYTLHITINNNVNIDKYINSCNTYISPNGNIYTQSGTYIDTLQTYNGCDSIIFSHIIVDSVNPNINIIGDTLFSLENNAIYRWLDCENNYSFILGGNSQSFIPPRDGIYSVELIKGACKDTSICYTVNTTDVFDVNKIKVNIFPNPTSSIVKINTELTTKLQLILTDIGGKIMVIMSFENSCQLDLNNYKSGIYYLELYNESEVIIKEKIIKY